MKKSALFILSLLCSVHLAAQDELKFCLVGLQSDELPAQAVNSIDTRLSQMLNRMSAQNDDIDNVFQLVPTIELTESTESEGLMREVARVKANLTLTVSNSIDDVNYYSVTVPLSGSAAGGRQEAMKQMALSLKPTDPVFVRFIRTTRKKITEYYIANCNNILRRASLLIDTGELDDARRYLAAVPAEVPCFDETSELLRSIYSPAGPDVVPDEVVDPLPEETEEPQPEPEIVPDPQPEPEIEPEPQPAPQAAPVPEVKASIKVSSDDLKVQLLSCKGSDVSDKVTIALMLTNLNENEVHPYCTFQDAFTSEGVQLKGLVLRNNNYSSGYIDLPDDVPVKVEFHITGVKSSVNTLARLNIAVGQVKIKISNLAVQW